MSFWVFEPLLSTEAYFTCVSEFPTTFGTNIPPDMSLRAIIEQKLRYHPVR